MLKTISKHFCLQIIVYICSMEGDLQILRGLHPGIALGHELEKRKLSKGRFALSINEYPQTISTITKGKRDMNTPLALRIEHALGIEEGYFMTLQVFYDIKEEKRKQQGNAKPDLSKLRSILFWDTSIDKIDWQQQKKAIIERVFERGNEEEKNEITRFYGADIVTQVLGNKNTKR